MTTEQYLRALKKLGLTPHSKETAAALGLSLRRVQDYAAGQDIPERVASMLRLMIENAKLKA